MIRLARDNMAEAEAHLQALSTNPDAWDSIDTLRAVSMVIMELGTLRKQRDAALSLHHCIEWHGHLLCDHCEPNTPWPCDTARAYGVTE